MGDDRTRVSYATRHAEAEEAEAPHRAGGPATPEECVDVEDREVDADVRARYREMTELGPEHGGGEGRIP